MIADARALEESSDRVDELLAELQRSAGPVTWQRVEELMRRLLELYGAGLERTLAHAAAAGAREDELRERLGGDELVASLLLVHGLHPQSTAERVEQALEDVRPMLGAHAGNVELLGVDEAGVVRLRLLGTCDGCPSAASTLEHAIRVAILDAAPEVAAIEVEGTP